MAMSQVGKIWTGWGVCSVFTVIAYYFMFQDVQKKRHENMEARKMKTLEQKREKRQKELEEIKAQAAKRDSIL